MKEVLDDENYDTPPQLPAENPEEHRVFDTEQAHPPRMWSTHPPNRDRENNAKVTYVAAPIDERPAWDIFRDPQILREKMTEHLLQGGGGDVEQLQKAALTDTVANVNKIYSKVIYERRYRGSYMGRSVVREFPTGADAIAGVDPGSLTKEQFDRLYPEELSDRFEHWRNLEEERATLRALRDGTLVSPDGIIRHRGVILKRKKLPEAIRQMREECDAARHDLCEHDRLVRGVHYAAAASLGDDWRNYHKGLVELLHYADHTEANVADAQGRLGNLWSVVIADGKVSSGEVKQLLTVASDLHDVLVGVDQQAAEVKLSSDVAARLNIRDWRSALNEEFGLPSPDKNNLGEWLSAADGWASYFRNALSALCIEALESLLAAEIRIEQSIRSGEAPGAAPTPASVPSGYPVLLPNTERKLQTRLGLWDRFQTADGFFPGLARFGVAAAIIGGLLGVGIYASNDADITIYNGLVTGVSVTADGETVVVAPLDTGTISPKPTSDLSISAYSDDGLLIESLVVDASNSFNSYVYNVASAAPLIRWTAVYGTTDERPPNYIGAQSWVEANVDFLFSDPPSEINTSGSGGTRSVLSAFEDFDPRYVEDYLPEGASSDELVRIHARWDHSNAPYSLVWLSLASALDGFPDILAHRLQRDENDVLALRFEQDTAADDVTKAAVCDRHTANAENAPRDSNWRYLAIRCGAGDEQQARAFIDAYAEWPDNSWIAGAAGYSYAEFGQWEPAVAALEDAYQRNRSLRLAYSDQLARARRMANGVDADISDVAPVSPWLQMNVVIESEQPADRLEMQSYQLLARGDVDGAMTIARPVDVFGDQMLRLTAASDGASRDLIARAKALDPERGITDDTLWAALGFAARHNLPAGALLEQVDDLLGEDATLARDFFAAVNAPRIDIRAAERLLQGADMTARGHAYAMGVVALNDRAPQSWRDGAQRLLFVPERPYFR